MDKVMSSLLILNRQIMKDLVGDDMDYIHKCEMDFIKQAQSIYNELVGAFKLSDFKAMKDKSHFLKTSAKAIGAEQLSHLLQTLEHKALSQDLDICKQLIVQISKAIKLVYEEIKRG